MWVCVWGGGRHNCKGQEGFRDKIAARQRMWMKIPLCYKLTDVSCIVGDHVLVMVDSCVGNVLARDWRHTKQPLCVCSRKHQSH